VTEPRPLGWKELGTLAPPSARVLVVEDDLGVRRGMERILAALGYEVRSAGSAEEADHWLSAERFELTLLDIELPRMKEWSSSPGPSSGIASSRSSC